jgi:hypothetical protein
MRRSLSFVLAAATLFGGMEIIAPAQAAFVAAPPVLVAAETSDGIVQVHRRGHRHRHRRHVVKRYHHPYAVRPYVAYPYAYPYAYHGPRYYPYYHSRPRASFSFSFGGGHNYYGW